MSFLQGEILIHKSTGVLWWSQWAYVWEIQVLLVAKKKKKKIKTLTKDSKRKLSLHKRD